MKTSKSDLRNWIITAITSQGLKVELLDEFENEIRKQTLLFVKKELESNFEILRAGHNSRGHKPSCSCASCQVWESFWRGMMK